MVSVLSAIWNGARETQTHPNKKEGLENLKRGKKTILWFFVTEIMLLERKKMRNPCSSSNCAIVRSNVFVPEC